MKYVPAFLLIALLQAGTLPAQREITLDDCFTFFKFYPQTAGTLHFSPDGHHYLEEDDQGISEFDLATGLKERTVVPLSVMKTTGAWDAYTFNSTQTKLLLRTSTKPVYRHSVIARYWVYDLASNTPAALYDEAPVQFAQFAADGEKVAFVAGNNLFFKDLRSGATTQVTNDGKKNEIINGLPDWVYEEEFSPPDGDGMTATAWSPDGQKLAFIRFDERAVPEYQMTWYTGMAHPRYTEFKFPKVGAPNSRVSVHVYDLATGQTVQVLPGTENQDIYLPRLYWTPDNLLCVYVLNRYQNNLSLVLYDPATQASGMLLDEMDTAYVDLDICDNLTFLPNNREFIWLSERDGHTHLYLLPRHDDSTATIRQLTRGDFDVMQFYGLDARSGKFYYQTATPTPMDRQVWEGSLYGGDPRLLTPGAGTHEAWFSPTFEFYVHQHSTINTPPTADLRTRSGDALRPLVRNEGVERMRKEYGFAPIEFSTVKAADSTDLNAWMLKPRNFDPAKKYPVLFDIYGGPGSQTVQNQYNGYTGAWHQLLAQKGYIIVSVDNRGTGARGRDFKKCTQLQLGKLETEDQIAAARQFAALPYVDPNRIGIWGWSFGGYLSSSCVLKGNDVFKMAMAVAPVTNWKWYDTAYTERFMHTTADNAAGYAENSPINFVDRLRGGNYLICHGINDDNVHWQQTVEMVNALIQANKQFETYYYPNRNHGIYGENATRHLFTKLTAFVLSQL